MQLRTVTRDMGFNGPLLILVSNHPWFIRGGSWSDGVRGWNSPRTNRTQLDVSHAKPGYALSSSDTRESSRAIVSIIGDKSDWARPEIAVFSFW